MTTPLIIGHRGAAAVAPENTLASFERAMRDGADGIEFDVRLSRDGIPVVIHDPTLTRTASINREVAKMPAAELASFDVPNLHEVLTQFKQRDALLNIELKSERGELALANAVVQAIQNESMTTKVLVSSFDMTLISEVKRIDNSIRTAALFEPRISRPFDLVRKLKLIDVARAHDADAIALHHRLVSSPMVEKARQAGLEVVVWIVDNPQWVARARKLGITALITNNPAVMVAV
ncbi:MAG TPA: glycerophosphodiester phosphodiesterase [Pyrinomonadaceae bacterium]|nr:glycerophosphodiester phosphodiesterase [Pyrinomonadaceae bacterium]